MHQTLADPRLAAFDRQMRRWMRQWNVPGAAVGVVQRGRIVHLAGYGFAHPRRNIPATPDTLFSIASCTKAMTAATLGLLVDDGRLDWDRPVRELLPGFRLMDPAASKLITPRDLLTHRSGLPRHDLFKEGSPLGRAEMVARLRHLRPSRSFRSTFQYNNLMFMVSGMIVERLSGRPWEVFVRERLFAPLGMDATRFLNGHLLGVDAAPFGDELAQGYERVGRRLVPWIKLFATKLPLDVAYGRACGPNGSVASTARDLCQWLRLQLGRGRVGRQTILSEKTLAEIHRPQVVVPQWSNAPWPELLDASYAFGWGVQPYRGRRWVYHDGNNCGFNAHVSFLPGESLGVALLTNISDSPLTRVVPFTVYDALLGAPAVNWNTRFTKEGRRRNAEKARREAAARRARRATVRLAPPRLAECAGRYRHAGYGPLVVEVDGRELVMRYNQFVMRFRAVAADVFESEGDGGMKPKTATFRRDARRRVVAVSLPMVEDVAGMEIEFRRQK
jgi:CubicO group peptidase (beta-lactamase class C family)